MKKAALTVMATAAILGGLVSSKERAPIWAGPVGTPIAVCYEDEPCWDCETMGNKLCGTP